MPNSDSTDNIELSLSDYISVSEANIGFCLECFDEQEMVEPDATNYKCHSCGELQVFGTEMLLAMNRITITEDE